MRFMCSRGRMASMQTKISHAESIPPARELSATYDSRYKAFLRKMNSPW